MSAHTPYCPASPAHRHEFEVSVPPQDATEHEIETWLAMEQCRHCGITHPDHPHHMGVCITWDDHKRISADGV